MAAQETHVMLSEEEEEEDEESEIDTTPHTTGNGNEGKVAGQDFGVVGEHLTSAATHAKH